MQIVPVLVDHQKNVGYRADEGAQPCFALRKRVDDANACVDVQQQQTHAHREKRQYHKKQREDLQRLTGEHV